MTFSQICKLAFICNGCFLATFAAHFRTFIPDNALGSSVIIFGQLVAVFLNIFVHLRMGIGRLGKHKTPFPQPRWLLVANFIILLIQGYYYFFFQS